MIRFISLLCFFTCAIQVSIAQTDTTKGTVLSPEATKQLLSQLKFDTTKMLAETAERSCNCIDSFLRVRKAGDNNSEILKNITACIDAEVVSYQLALKMYRALTSSDKNIMLSTEKNSSEYGRYYKDIETWLADSCVALRSAMSSNDEKETELSFSKDPEAIRQYNAGIKYLNIEEYGVALTYFDKAVSIDPKFVFAIDNLAICYRRTGEFDKALATYDKSLALSPKGKTALQNIPVVYELKKDYPKALQAYKTFLKYYPGDAEVYYGMGRISIIYTGDLEGGVDYMCKAYNIYVKDKSPYSADAEKNLSYAYQKMKEQGKEETFFKILKDNNISTK